MRDSGVSIAAREWVSVLTERSEIRMGSFHYDVGFSADFEDRLLAHLQIVIGAKLRRGEGFYFSWRDDGRVGNGRTTIWIHPAVSLRYKYYGGRMPRINPAWIRDLSISANSASGLQLVPEPPAPLPPEGAKDSQG
jgi:hypothetical protein